MTTDFHGTTSFKRTCHGYKPAFLKVSFEMQPGFKSVGWYLGPSVNCTEMVDRVASIWGGDPERAKERCVVILGRETANG